MNGVFSYDSKPMQMLMRLGDLIILNLVYLLCCLPVFTIGAAQAGLYTAAKVMSDKEDDSSPTKAFFRGFRTGFGNVTLAWLLVSAALAVVIYFAVSAAMLGAPIWLVIIAVVVTAIFQTLVPAFHARFVCTPWQLIRNTWFMLFAHPLRSIGATILVWFPVAFFLLDMYHFMAIAPVWVAVYYSGAFSFAYALLKKPFTTLIDHFNETHGITPEPPAENPNAVFEDVVETSDEE